MAPALPLLGALGVGVGRKTWVVRSRRRVARDALSLEIGGSRIDRGKDADEKRNQADEKRNQQENDDTDTRLVTNRVLLI
jgi:hypothetical protein